MGELWVSFNRGRGLRKEGPHVPYLFTMVMEYFTLVMEKNVRNSPEFNYHFGCKQLKITHICFADDLLVFFHGDTNSVSLIKNSVDEFGSCSGLLPNFNKSIVFFGSISEEDQQELLNILPFGKGKLPMKYLGVPLISKRLGVNDCKILIDKVKTKINHRRNKFLTYAGKLQLIASVLESIQSYWCCVFLLPKTVVNDINRIMKNFLWSQSDESKGKAKVAWKAICKPKREGGLGLKDLMIWNQALLVNLHRC
ncbi:RNA-directed DNA polymerase, eukaryota, reverse transcriptase zinc-binding domain protein [Tanacetum coccineum]